MSSHSLYLMRCCSKRTRRSITSLFAAATILFTSSSLHAQSGSRNAGARQPSANVPATSARQSQSSSNNAASSAAAPSTPVQYGSYALRQRNSAANNNAAAPAVVPIAPILLDAPTTFATVPTAAPGSTFVGVTAAQQQGRLVGVSLTNPNSASATQAAIDATSALNQSSSASQNLGFGVGYIQPVEPGPTIQVKLGFAPRFIPPDETGLAIAKRLGKLPSLHFTTPVSVALDGRTAILTGTVASAHDRDLAERVVLLESSVDDVQNQLVVAPATLPPPPLPGDK